MRTSHAEPAPLGQPTFALSPAACLFNLIEAFVEAVTVDQKIIDRLCRRLQEIGAAHGEGVKAELGGHAVQEGFEGKADIDRAVPAHRAAGWRIGQNAGAVIAHIVECVDGIQERAGIEDGDDAIAAEGAAALHGFAFGGGETPVLCHADLERHLLFGPAPVGDEGFLAAGNEPHPPAGGARQQGADDLDIEGLGARAEAAADMRFDDADTRLVHVQAARQHQVDIKRHLGRAMNRQVIAQRIIGGQRGVGFGLHLAHFGAMKTLFTHQIGLGKAVIDLAQIIDHVALDIAGPLGMQC